MLAAAQMQPTARIMGSAVAVGQIADGVKAVTLELEAAAAAARGRGDDVLARYIAEEVAEVQEGLEKILADLADKIAAIDYSVRHAAEE